MVKVNKKTSLRVHSKAPEFENAVLKELIFKPEVLKTVLEDADSFIMIQKLTLNHEKDFKTVGSDDIQVVYHVTHEDFNDVFCYVVLNGKQNSYGSQLYNWYLAEPKEVTETKYVRT